MQTSPANVNGRNLKRVNAQSRKLRSVDSFSNLLSITAIRVSVSVCLITIKLPIGRLSADFHLLQHQGRRQEARRAEAGSPKGGGGPQRKNHRKVVFSLYGLSVGSEMAESLKDLARFIIQAARMQARYFITTILRARTASFVFRL
jgi:hypothetical protein